MHTNTWAPTHKLAHPIYTHSVRHNPYRGYRGREGVGEGRRERGGDWRRERGELEDQEERRGEEVGSRELYVTGLGKGDD